ncbi:Myb-like_DNA-binding domain-containing protein [Hexamita inflata]|uniref:Myb-like DNA-binding domain-containing protein n=1 Tax=Hexamita inflata TaxID=28002 RepID=A0AA86PYW6_9EUKA|nr:Myb-like DNA-binding domain-containing protein [Hexamita inflata]
MKQLWSHDEKRQLLDLVQQYMIHNRINWVEVANKLENRTEIQCKLQYRNVLHQNTIQVNKKWTVHQEQQLTILNMFYGKKWTFLQQNYFQQFTVEQVRQKAILLNQKSVYGNILLEKIYKQIPYVFNKSELKFIQQMYNTFKQIEDDMSQFKQNSECLLNGELPQHQVNLDYLEIEVYKKELTDKQEFYDLLKILRQYLNE